jgi:uncharacterized membrane protein
MGKRVSQTLANHARLDPPYHFFLAPLSIVLLVWSIAHLVRHYSHEAIAWVVVALLIFVAVFKLRTYALRVQDRLIRLEENLRLTRLSSGGILPVLTEGQLIALRFACDAEAPSLAEKAAANQLTPKQIKQAIQTWRPDYFRV